MLLEWRHRLSVDSRSQIPEAKAFICRHPLYRLGLAQGPNVLLYVF